MIKIKDLRIVLSLLFISSLFWLFPYIDFLIRENTPLPHLPGINTATIDIPMVFFIAYAIHNRRIRLPFFMHFVITLVLFVIIEYTHNAAHSESPNLSYAIRLLRIYLYFIVLITIGRINGFQFLFRWTIRFGIISIILIYGGYLGLYKGHHSSYVIGGASEFIRTGDMGSKINVNILSFQAILVLVSIIAYYEFFGPFFKKKFYLYLFVFLIALEVILHASRGAFLALVCILAIFMYHYYQRDFLKIVLSTGFIILLYVLFQTFIFSFITSLQLFERFSENPEEISRFVQMKASWNSFIQSPYFGVGYDNTVSAYDENLTKSNFTWTQIMASSGIFYFAIYFSYTIRLYSYSVKQIFQKIPLIVLAFVFINLSTHLPAYYLSLLGVISYYHYFHTRTLALNEESPNHR